MKRPRVGGGPNGSWPPFEKGNDKSLVHGAYSSELRLAPRAEEIAAVIRAQLDEGDVVRFGLLVSTAAATAARAEAALLAMGDPDDPNESERLSRDASRWVKVWLQCLSSLNLTPASARAAAGDAGLRRLAAHLEAVYVEGAVEGEATDA